MKKLLSRYFKNVYYTSGSQPGVRVPLGVRQELTGDTRNYFEESLQ